MLEWKGQPAAFNIALVRGSRHLTYLVSRDPAIRGRSPGKLLDAYVIKQALDAGARCFDFGLGDEDYKLHHASGVAEVANWSLYP
jgi:CelD/BcsL family acetyltransferase involved in cellulose biosynthesis